MRWPFVSRRAYEAVCADRERIRGERNQFEQDRNTARAAMRTAARQFADADATNRRLMGRNLELGRRLSQLTESDPAYAARLELRVARLKRVVVRIWAAGHAEYLRADRLQKRLDDAVGLGSDGIADSRVWQPGYVEPKPASKAVSS